MIEITNHTGQALDFKTGVKDGEPVTKAVLPGETAKIAVEKTDPVVVARLAASAISVKGVAAARREPAAERKPAEPPAPDAPRSDFKSLAG